MKFIFKEYLELKSLGKVQKLLEEKSLKTARGKDFSRQTIVNVLKNPTKGNLNIQALKGK